MSDLKQKHCRTCVELVTSESFFNIYIIEDLAKKLMLCTGQTIEPTDEYPEQLCRQCYEKVELFYEFQQMCCKALEKFQELLRSKENCKSKDINENDCDPLKQNHRMSNQLKPIIKSADNVQNLGEPLEKKKRGRPSKNQLGTQRLQRKTVLKRQSGTVIRKSVDDTISKEKMKHQLKEYSQLKKESKVYLEIEYGSESQESLKEQSKTNLIIEKIQEMEPNLFTGTESCSSVQEITKTQTTNHECNRCSKQFKSLRRLQAHIRQHDGLPPYLCTFKGCERTFDRWCSFKKHQKQHNSAKEESFKCDLDNCERVYKNKANLNIHKRKFHNSDPKFKTHMCEICGKVFINSAVLNNHQYTHIEDKTQLPFACEEEDCDKRFSNKEKLKIHKMRHAGIKNFVCPHCGMRKTTRNELKTHINYHTLERTWPCRFCPKICNNAGNLKMHVKSIHERTKEFACRYCQRTFAKADTKKYHEMTYTGEKPHQCKECGRRFLQPAALRTHRKIHIRQKGNMLEFQKCKVVIVTEDEKSPSENIEESEANILTESIVVEILSETNGR